jgi:hypothetical protein
MWHEIKLLDLYKFRNEFFFVKTFGSLKMPKKFWNFLKILPLLGLFGVLLTLRRMNFFEFGENIRHFSAYAENVNHYIYYIYV